MPPRASVQQKSNRFLEIVQAFLPGLALAIGAWNFQARRPKTTLIRIAAVNDCCEVLHR